MGIEPFMVAAAIDCVVAQRLMRTLCTYCRARPSCRRRCASTTACATRRSTRPAAACAARDTGFSGRIGIYEVMRVDDEIRSLLLRRAPAEEMAAAARRGGMRTMYEDGLAKVAAGRHLAGRADPGHDEHRAGPGPID